MTAEAITFTRAQAPEMLCPVRDLPCVADKCALFQWTTPAHVQPALGKCGLSSEYA